jgi:hypothetical protein
VDKSQHSETLLCSEENTKGGFQIIKETVLTGWDHNLVVEHLPSISEALSSVLCTANN